MSRNAPLSKAKVAGGRHRPEWLAGVILAGALCAASGAVLWDVDPRGPHGRVVIVHDPAATEALQPVPERVQAMLERGLTNLTAQPTAAAAWRSLVPTNEVVGIKVYAAPGPRSGTRPAVVAAVLEGLRTAGHPPQKIIIWDESMPELLQAGYGELAKRYGVRLAASDQAGYDGDVHYEHPLIGHLSFTDHDFGRVPNGISRKSYVTRLLTKEIQRIICITPLLNQNHTGVVGHLYSLALGSVDNRQRFLRSPGALAQVVPEIYALPQVADRVVLNITDALLAQYEGQHVSMLHYSKVLNELWLSRDPVALDTLALRTLKQLRVEAGIPRGAEDLELLQNAELLQLGVHDATRITVERLP